MSDDRDKIDISTDLFVRTIIEIPIAISPVYPLPFTLTSLNGFVTVLYWVYTSSPFNSVLIHAPNICFSIFSIHEYYKESTAMTVNRNESKKR